MNANPNPHVNELLCFVQQKSRVMSFDHLLDLCTNFYNSGEIKTAHSTVMNCAKKRDPKYTGDDKDKKCVTDIIKVCLDSNVHLPTFCALKLDRLPPVDINHVDVSALLQELSLLRQEVKTVWQLRTEMTELRNSMELLKTRTLSTAEFPPLMEATNVTDSDGPAAGNATRPTLKSYTDHAKGLRDSGLRVQTRPARVPVVGSSTTNKSVKAVHTVRTINVFVSRLHPMTTVSEVKDCVNEIKSDSLPVHDVQCVKLKARYEHLYSSFQVQIHVSSSDMKRALELYMANESWPNGVFVRRYFPKKEQDGNEEQ